MRIRSKLLVVVAAGLAAPLVSAQQSNPHVLNIDRVPYALPLPQGSAALSAAAGSSSPMPVQRQPQADLERMAAAARSGEEASAHRARENEHRISALVQERDAWKRRAGELESELRTSRGSVPAYIHRAPVSR